MGTTRKNLSGCTIFLLLYAWKKISDMIPQEIPEPTKTKMIDKKLDELLKTRNKASILKMPRTRPKPAAETEVFVDALEPVEPERQKWLEDTPFHKLLDMDRENNALIKKFASIFNTKDHRGCALLLQFYATKGSITTPLECDNRGKKTRDKECSGSSSSETIESSHLKEMDTKRKIYENVMAEVRKCQRRMKVHESQRDVMEGNFQNIFSVLESQRDTTIATLQKCLDEHVAALQGIQGTTYVGIVDDVNGLKKKKWATHALDNLVHGINTYKNGMGTIRKNLSGYTIFLLEIPEPKRTKMINKKHDELLKTRNKASIFKMPRTRSKPAAETEGLNKYDLLRTTTTTQEEEVEEESQHNVRVKVRTDGWNLNQLF
ncbi:hypothetical protein Tco_0153002 [Tanacetum coccineum]